MKIAISWTFNSGKTTLANTYKSHNIILETEREVIRSLSIDLNNCDYNTFVAFSKILFNKQKILEEQYDSFVTDTPRFLMWIYLSTLYPYNSCEHWDRLIWQSLDTFKHYDKIIHLNPKPIVEDWERHKDGQLQQEINDKLLHYYAKNQVNVEFLDDD